MFDKVLDIRKCWLQPDPSNDIRMETKRFCVENGYTFHNAREHTGLMRNMIVRTASTGEVMVTVVFGADDRERIAALLDHLAAAFPQITSLCYVVNTKLNDSVGDLDPVCYKGKDHIVEEMEGLRFKVGPKSFYQTNSEQAYELYKVARSFAGLTGGETLYDLYTGTGTIANFVARTCRQVVGIEYVPEAIEDAKCNSRLNGIDNTAFFAGDMKDVLDDAFIARRGDTRPAAGRRTRGGAGDHQTGRPAAHRLRELQPRDAGPRPRPPRTAVPCDRRTARGYVPAHAPRRKCRPARQEYRLKNIRP